MSLENLLRAKRRIINNMDLSSSQISVNVTLNKMQQRIAEIQGVGDILSLVKDVNAIQINAMSEFTDATKKKFAGIIAEIDKKIEMYSKALNAVSLPLVEYDQARYRRVFNIDGDTLSSLAGRISKYSSWQYPAIEINPRSPTTITTKLVASDPLYLIETEYQEFLDDTTNIFTPEYQARLRSYFIKDNNFSALPQNQFGFVLSAISFNFMPMSQIEIFMKNVFQLLAPGGTFLFTYNNCEDPKCARMAEDIIRTYTTQTDIVTAAKNLGYEISEMFNPQNSEIHWIEIKKPGTLSTIKGHQTLGEIKQIE